MLSAALYQAYTLNTYSYYKSHFFPDENIYQRVIRINESLIPVIGLEARGITVMVENSPVWNAYATKTWDHNKFIILNEGLINDVNDDELALVLAHEYAHHLLDHVESLMVHRDRVGFNPKYAEKMADFLGYYISVTAGYDKCAGYNLWSRKTEESGDYILGESHPSGSQRTHYYKQSCEIEGN